MVKPILLINHFELRFRKVFLYQKKQKSFFNTTKFPVNLSTVISKQIVINEGDYVSLSGPNGAGKSTFLKALYANETIGLKKSYSEYKGSIEYNTDDIGIKNKPIKHFNENELSILRDKLVFLSQEDTLRPYETVVENIVNESKTWINHRRHAYRFNSKKLLEKVEKLGEELRNKYLSDVFEKEDFEHLDEIYPSSLSGGQRRIIFIISQILSVHIKEPKFLFIDEPLNNLDFNNIIKFNDLLIDLKEKYPKLTIFIISHYKLIFGTNKTLLFRKITPWSYEIEQINKEDEPYIPPVDKIKKNNNKYKGIVNE